MAEYQRIENAKAEVTVTCLCGGDIEIDFDGPELDGTTQVDLTCDDCGRSLLVYADVDVRVSTDG